jgi:hypothetical protein
MEHFVDKIFIGFLPISSSFYIFDCFYSNNLPLDIVYVRLLANIINILIILFLYLIVWITLNKIKNKLV